MLLRGGMLHYSLNLSLRDNTMIGKLTAAALMLSAMSLAGCGSSDPHEQAVEDMVENVEEMVSILESVKDKPSAEAAKTKLQAVKKNMEAIDKRMKELGEPDKAKEEALKEKYEPRMTELQEKTKKEMLRIAKNPECAALIMEAMQGVRP